MLGWLEAVAGAQERTVAATWGCLRVLFLKRGVLGGGAGNGMSAQETEGKLDLLHTTVQPGFADSAEEAPGAAVIIEAPEVEEVVDWACAVRMRGRVKECMVLIYSNLVARLRFDERL